MQGFGITSSASARSFSHNAKMNGRKRRGQACDDCRNRHAKCGEGPRCRKVTSAGPKTTQRALRVTENVATVADTACSVHLAGAAANDDDLHEDADMKAEPTELIDDIAPNFAGFQQHVLKLNPRLNTTNNYLVDRIAHQQCIRYQNLLDLRVKHLQAIAANNCSCGTMCISLGGRANVLDSKGGQRCLSAGRFPQGIPMPPTATFPAQFECQLCFSAEEFQMPSDWTKHVYEDIQPFTCTWENCKEPKMFRRKADWVRHESQLHRHLESWICDVGDCRYETYRRGEFLDHLVQGHDFVKPKIIWRAKSDNPTWVRVNQCLQTTADLPEDEPCRFCGRAFASWDELTAHLAKHMEHISLPVHKLIAKKEDTIIRPIQEPPPRTFPTQPGGHLSPPQGGGGPRSSPPYNFSGLPLPGHAPSPQIPQVLPPPGLTKHPLLRQLPGVAELTGISAYGMPARTVPYDSGGNGGGISLLSPHRLSPRSDQPNSQPEPQPHPPQSALSLRPNETRLQRGLGEAPPPNILENPAKVGAWRQLGDGSTAPEGEGGVTLESQPFALGAAPIDVEEEAARMAAPKCVFYDPIRGSR